MVATRRGTRVGSPVKYSSDENSGATQRSPSSRRTQRRTLMEENQSQAELTGDSQPDEPKDDSTTSSLATSRPKRDTRRSMRLLADKKQPDSTHEADVSESESCCSVVSDVQATPRTRRRTVIREKRTEQDEVSEAESCSSTMSPTHSRRAPRSLRKRVLTSAAPKDAQKVDDDDDPSGAESCSSAVSVTKVADTHRITRSHRKTAVPTTEADPFEPDSCSSSVSGICGSVVRRSARNQKVKTIKPIPLTLEETTDTPSSPVSRKLRDRRHKTGIEDDEYDTDGCKSGPSMSPWRSTRRQAKLKTLVDESDSESVATDICTSQGSPSPQRGRGTPCSSRTGSASSARAIPVTRTRSKARLTSDVSDAAAMLEEQKEGEEHEPHESIQVPDGDKAEDTVDQLDSTMTMDTSEAQECTMIEEKAEDTTIVLDQDEPIEKLEPQSSMQDIKPVEDCGPKTLTPQDEPVAETSATLTEDREELGDVSMENNELEFVETSHVVVDQTCTDEPKNDSTASSLAASPPKRDTRRSMRFLADKKQPDSTHEADVSESESCCSVVSDVQATPRTRRRTVVREKRTEQDELSEAESCSSTMSPTHSHRAPRSLRKRVLTSEASKDPQKVDDDDEKPEPQSSLQDIKEQAATKDEPAVVEKATEDQKCSVPVTEDTIETAQKDLVPVVGEQHEEMAECERKGVIVTEEANDTVTTTEDDSVALKDLEGPSTSSHTQANLTTSKELPSQKEMISLLDSSEDEDSADEGLSSEEEGCSQEAEDVDREDDVMCPDGNQMSEEAEAHGNGLFVIDTRPGLQPEEQYYVDAKQIEEEDEDDFVDEEGGDDEDVDSKVLFTPKKHLMQLSSSIDPGLKMKELGGLYISFDGNKPKNISKTKNNPNNQDELLKKSVIVPDFEKKDAVPPYKESKNAAKLKRKAEREKTSGSGWFNMKAPEVTEELKNDLKALKMRSAMDPKRFYKKNDREGFPKYFQVGTVVDSPVDFYNSRIPKKQRKRTIVEELLADAEFRSYNKRKYQEIMTEKAAQAAGKMNKKHKFHKKKMNK